MYRVTADTIEQLKEEGFNLWTISLWETWLDKVPGLESAIESIRSAFDGVTLDGGIGLREANAIDDYALVADREAARALDEKTSWQNIETDLLNQCYVAPTYFDAKGFLFHLPAFLLAEFNDEFDFEFIDQLIEKHPTKTGWIDLLDNAQAAAIIETLDLLKSHPDYYAQTDAIEKAISRIANRRQ